LASPGWHFFCERTGLDVSLGLSGEPRRWRRTRTFGGFDPALGASTGLSRCAPSTRVNALHLQLSRSGGDLYWLATKADGNVKRLDPTGNPARVGEPELTTAATHLAGKNDVAEQRLISKPHTCFIGF